MFLFCFLKVYLNLNEALRGGVSVNQGCHRSPLLERVDKFSQCEITNYFSAVL